MATASTTQQTPAQQDAMAQAQIRALAIERTQQIYIQTVTPNTSPSTTIIPNAVGLLKRFRIEVTATLTNSGAAQVTATDLVGPNLLSSIRFTDLQNNTRVNVTGPMLALNNSIRKNARYQAAFTAASADSSGVIGYGSNVAVESASATIAGSGGTGTVQFNWELPIAYSDLDYRGAIFMNILNAVSNIQLNWNQNPGVVSGDTTFACYTGATAVTSLAITSAKVRVYQVYMDQIPQGSSGPILPGIALSKQYLLQYTNYQGMVQGQDFPMQYANLRQFISSLLIFNDGNSSGGGRAGGTDINTLGLQTANQSYLFKYDPITNAIDTRNYLGTDLPLGHYYFSYRNKPFSTQNYGNLQLVLNASSIGGVQTPYTLLMQEMFADISTVAAAGSLSAS